MQGLKVFYANVNNGIFEIFVAASANSAICPHYGDIIYKVHDKRYQEYKHLPIWGMPTVINLQIKKCKCVCNPEHSFEEHFNEHFNF